jgi:hypothetical protein
VIYYQPYLEHVTIDEPINLHDGMKWIISLNEDKVLVCVRIIIRQSQGLFGKAPAPASLALDPDPREELILLILLENQNHF